MDGARAPLAPLTTTSGSIPTRPTSDHAQLRSPTSAHGIHGQKRNQSHASLESSPGSDAEGADGHGRRQPGVKRACNECRQQKLRCNVVQEPEYQSCARCIRLGLKCKIDSNFRRIGKRSKNAEMEQEIQHLKQQLAGQQLSPVMQYSPSTMQMPSGNPLLSHMKTSSLDQYMGSHEAVASLLDLRSGLDGGCTVRSPRGQLPSFRRLEDVSLPQDQIRDLFQHYFTCYFPFLPILDSGKPPEYFYDVSPLLFWTIITVAARRGSHLARLANPYSRLLWATIADVPQNHAVVQALCILCTWPLPVSSTSSDPTFMLCGVMMRIAMQIGLHRPSHLQDFGKFPVELREEEVRDRVMTWGACNVVAQRVATGYGQPSNSRFDWSLTPVNSKELSSVMNEENRSRLVTERFCHKVTAALYSCESSPVGLVDDVQRPILTNFLANDYRELEQRIVTGVSPITTLYFQAAGLHLRLGAFFDSPTAKNYSSDLLALWLAATTFLETALGLDLTANEILPYASNYVLQMIVAAGFALMKLLKSFFASYIDLDYGRTLFSRTIRAIRIISVTTNDLPARLAEVLAQLWRGGRAGSNKSSSIDNSLQLKVRCRMSMSLVFDSVWRWREDFEARGRGNLESALNNPTNPDSATESSASSIADPALAVPTVGFSAQGMPTPAFNYDDMNYEVFDPLNWTLDGLVDFPYSFPNPEMSNEAMVL